MKFMTKNFTSLGGSIMSEMRWDITLKTHLSESLYFIRGIAIVLVIIGHVIGDNKNNGMRKMYSSDIFGLSWLADFIYTFHMPVFLMVSGVAFAVFSKKDGSYLEFARSKLNRLIVPLVCWTPPFFIFHSLSQGKHFSLIDVIKAVIFPYSMFWFLHALIFASLFSFCFFKLFRSPLWYFLISICLFTFSLFFKELLISFYFSFNIFYALGVFLAYYLPNAHLILEKLSSKIIFLILFSCSILMLTVKHFMATNHHPLATIINGVLAFVFLYTILDAHRIKLSYEPLNKLLQSAKTNILYAGKLSMVLYLFHMYFATLTRIFLVKGFSITEPTLHFILGSLTAFLGPILVYQLLQKRSKVFMYSIGEGK
jgi:fucose 4-O-acetylase-like acetyltransferase